MEKILVFGHKNPDTDTICSAIAMAYLKKQLGVESEAVCLGGVNDETAFALKAFKTATPRQIGDVSLEAKQVILVDHNEFAQSADGIEKVEIIEVVDHHRIANFETTGPLFYHAEPVGCTATIITKMFVQNSIEIPTAIAGLLLSAIISDTLLFKSPTSTPQDEQIATELAQKANVDVNIYGLNLLKAGASIAGKSATELINIDSKPFSMGTFNVEVAQISVVDLADVRALKVELLVAMEDARTAKQQDLFFVIVTDILANNSFGIISGSGQIVEMAFGAKIIDDMIELPGIVSRKKQVVPAMTTASLAI
ncbi:MAG: manganese-dependent inorganic pyrophosphatase [Culicoidibacterales bacterium]